MKWLTVLGEIGSFILKHLKLSEKDKYEKNRLKDSSSAADSFESKFNPNGLRSESMSGDDSDTRKRK
ncbi:hypothetical protein pVco5_074 [Vibrio phage pVco-5]|uniref:Uncharacterized protein n=1 Tax=Vibrio phage pVco-5 TaxID=1965485 RepID=A0A1W6JUY1_9CAUD|nr:hypothetical protein KNT61_gp074 [Vibrio phage pVco-5]ARM71062.1 hypothetical protein pVco5_074 [Vibrio phage pVco-5]